MRNIENFGIWNIPLNIKKRRKTTKILKILEYGIFHWLFLKYYKYIYIYIYNIYIRGRKVIPGE